MGSITDVLLITDMDEDEAVATVNAWLREHDYRKQQLHKIDLSSAGGDKVITTDLYAAAFNYLDIEGLEKTIAAAPWESPERVATYFNFSPASDTWLSSPARTGRWDLCGIEDQP